MDIRETHEGVGSEQEAVVDEMYGFRGDPMKSPPPPRIDIMAVVVLAEAAVVVRAWDFSCFR